MIAPLFAHLPVRVVLGTLLALPGISVLVAGLAVWLLHRHDDPWGGMLDLTRGGHVKSLANQ